MKFGIFYEWPNPALDDWQRLFEESIEQIQYAEELGYDYVFVAEHHFSNYGMTPAPLLQALKIAERTSRIKIATLTLVLPTWHALRLAEEVAVLDNFTDGRFICGIGRGFLPYEFDRFGVDMEDSRGAFEETFEVLKKAWTEEEFVYDGEHIKVPHPTTVWPRPLQKPYPPVWMVGSSADSIAYAARNNLVPFSTSYSGPEGARASAAAWVQARIAAGLPLEPYELGMQTHTIVADSDAGARDLVHYDRWQTRGNRSLMRRDVNAGRVNAIPFEGEDDDEAFWDRFYFGSPATVLDKYRRAGENGVTILSTWLMMGGIPHETVMHGLGLLGKEVLPALRDLRPDPEWLASLADESPVMPRHP